MTKKVFIFIVFALFVISACAKKNKESAVLAPDTDGYKVTFIELGSVNCVPCKMMQPIMKKIEADYAGQVKVIFYDVWTEEGKPYAGFYGISAIPTQVFLDGKGKEYYRHIGYFPEKELVEILKKQGVN